MRTIFLTAGLLAWATTTIALARWWLAERRERREAWTALVRDINR